MTDTEKFLLDIEEGFEKACAKATAGDYWVSELRKGFRDGLAILQKKNNDYAGQGTRDPFKNFRVVQVINLAVEKGIIVRMLDKITRLDNLCTQDAAVTDESFEDTCADLMNYSNILRVWRKWARYVDQGK